MTLDLGTRMKLVSNEGYVRHGLATVTSPFGPASAFTRKEKPDLHRDGGGPRSIRRLGGAACARLRKWLELREDLLGPRWRLYGQTKPVGGVVPARGIHHVDL